MNPTEETNFIVITKIQEFSMQDIVPMAIAFNYPLLAIATSSNSIVVFNFETKITAHLERNSQSDNAVLCADVSPERTHIVTGHSDGEVVLWSLQSGTAIMSQHTQELISYIGFGSNLNIFHADSNGSLCKTVVSQNIFKKTVTTQLLYNFGQPLTALSVHDNVVYVSTCAETLAFKTQPEFKVLWKDASPTSCFAFLETGQRKLVARGIGHSVVISGFDGVTQKVFDFSQTPKVVSLLDENSALVLFNGACEMAVGDRRFRRSVPKGMALAHKDKIYIAGAELMQLSLANISQRVNNYIEEGNWEMAFAQISSPDDVDDLTGMLHSFLVSDKFNAKILFDFVERMNMTDFIVQMMFTERKEEIFAAFIDSGITKWKLTLDFILAIADATKDDEKLIKFLSSIEINLEWLQRIYTLCFERDFKDLMIHFALDYCGDIYLALLLSEYAQNYENEHELLKKSLFDSNDIKGVADSIYFLITVNLTGFISYDKQSASKIFQVAMNMAPNVGVDKGVLINRVLPVLEPTSPFWGVITPIIVESKITIEKEAMKSVNRYVFMPTTADVDLRKEMLLTLLVTNQLDDIRKYLSLVRAVGFKDIEGKLIVKLGDVDEFLSLIISSGEHNFATKLFEVTKDEEVITKFLIRYPRSLIPINPDEYADLVWRLCNTETIHQIAKSISDSQALLWHFLSRLFSHPEFFAKAEEQLCIKYAIFLAKFKPNELLPVLKQMPNVAVDKILDVCLERNVLDCVLYLCLVTQEIEKGTNFATDNLLNSLMEGGDPVVVREIISFLSGIKGHPDYDDIWARFLAVFQLPLYAVTEEPGKSNVISLLGDFVQAMTLVVNPIFVTKQFSSLFSFLPFKDARPLIARLFRAIREKNEFTRTFSRIVKEEAIEAQIKRVKDLGRGFNYDAVRCAACRQKICACNAFASRCGHVFHSECAKSAWCPICRISFRYGDAEQNSPHVSSLLSMFEESVEKKMDDSMDATHQAQNKTQSIASTISLEAPTIGTIVPQRNSYE